MNRKGKVVGFRLTQVSSPALPLAAEWPWTRGRTALGPGKTGDQTPARGAVVQIEESQAGKVQTQQCRWPVFTQRFIGTRLLKLSSQAPEPTLLIVIEVCTK